MPCAGSWVQSWTAWRYETLLEDLATGGYFTPQAGIRARMSGWASGQHAVELTPGGEGTQVVLNALGTAAILHVAVWRRWPVPARPPG